MALYRMGISTASHEDLSRGVTESRYSEILLDAESDSEACLLACQIAACTSGGVPTACELLDFPTQKILSTHLGSY